MLKMEKRVLIAFIPQKKIVENLKKIRKIAKIKIERNSGLKTPHITIVDNSYFDIKRVDKELRKIAKSTKPFTVKIKGLNTFAVKKVLKIERYKQNNSLIYLIENNPRMSKFRKDVLTRLNFLKTNDRFEQWKRENPNISKTAIKNIKKYGTPFGLKEWKFHTTIGLIPKSKQKEILKKIERLNLSEEWHIGNFGLFVRKKGWILFKKYHLI